MSSLTIRFGPLPEAALTAVRNGSAEQLLAWTARALTDASLDQLFR